MAGNAPSEDTTEFRFSAWDRAGIALALALLWLIVLLMAGFAATFVTDGQWLLAGFMLAMSYFIGLLCRMVHRDFGMKNGWRMSLAPLNGWFHLPIWRLMYGPQPSMSGPLAYAAIRQIEWRRETTTSLGMAATNHVYAIRLKSGGAIILAEDRPIPKTDRMTTFAGKAARALTARAGVKLEEVSSVTVNSGFLTLWGTSRPDWPGTQSEFSDQDNRRLARQQTVMLATPALTFAAALLILIFY